VCIYTGADFQPETAEQVRRAIKTADRHGQFVIAHDQTVMLSEAETETIRRFGTDPSRRMPGTVYDNPFTGICAVPRRLFDDVGGFDERFAGWGWEDQSFWAACWALRGRFGRIRGRAFHLWHPRERVDNEDSPTHATAEVLGRRYLAARRDPAEMRKILDERVA
jgi:hypothetical protein